EGVPAVAVLRREARLRAGALVPAHPPQRDRLPDPAPAPVRGIERDGAPGPPPRVGGDRYPAGGVTAQETVRWSNGREPTPKPKPCRRLVGKPHRQQVHLGLPVAVIALGILGGPVGLVVQVAWVDLLRGPGPDPLQGAPGLLAQGTERVGAALGEAARGIRKLLPRPPRARGHDLGRGKPAAQDARVERLTRRAPRHVVQRTLDRRRIMLLELREPGLAPHPAPPSWPGTLPGPSRASCNT